MVFEAVKGRWREKTPTEPTVSLSMSARWNQSPCPGAVQGYSKGIPYTQKLDFNVSRECALESFRVRLPVWRRILVFLVGERNLFLVGFGEQADLSVIG